MPSQKRPVAVDATDLSSDNEIEEQLCAHATLAYNDFVQFFQRRSSQRIAENRMITAKHIALLERIRKRYPMAASVPYHNAMQNISAVQTSEPPETSENLSKNIKITVRNSSETVTIVKQSVLLPRVPPIPNATMWTALTKNYEVEDEPHLRFLPYFGDDDEDDVVSEFYHIKLQRTSAIEVEFTKELCEFVIKQLETTWELSSSDLERIANTIQVEKEVVIEIHKQLRLAQRVAKKKRRQAETEANPEQGADPTKAVTNRTDSPKSQEPEQILLTMERHLQLYEKAADSFRTLFCRRCYVYDCDYHGCVEVPKLEITEQNAVAEQARTRENIIGTGRNCGNQCFLGRTGSTTKFSKARAISAAFGWDSQTRIACARAYFVCSGNFCEVARIMGNKTCLEVAEFCEFYDINDSSLAAERRLNRTRRGKKKIRMSVAHLQKSYLNSANSIATKIEPCAHLGPCDDGHCSCIENGRLCSKLCNCVHEECKIFFKGCKCQKGRCRSKICPCFAAGRECDLDLCKVCCADEIAALSLNGKVDRMDEKYTNPSPSSTSCHNRSVVLGKTKHTRVGRSTMENAGWGLYVDEPVAKDEFIIEYIGEMVSQEEAERRGAIYDKHNRSYLFNLDTETVVDATRKGNKTRFINHSSKPNCFAKIININSDYRIGIYALRNIKPHTELCFDYRYDKVFHHAYLLKQPIVTEWMKDRKH